MDPHNFTNHQEGENFMWIHDGGIQIRGKTPVTSVATSLKRDPRFRKVAPNTFVGTDESGKPLSQAV